jgi:alpha-L-arabinofuranosidase
MLTLRRQGASPGDRWKWNETIGPVENRPGRQGKIPSPFPHHI